MAPLKIAVSLDNVPRMLRTIVVEALQHDAGVEMVAEDQAIDALIVSGAPDPGRLMQRSQASRLLDLAADGRKVTLHRLRHEQLSIGEPSPERLLALLHDRVPGRQPGGWCRLLTRCFARRGAHEQPGPPDPAMTGGAPAVAINSPTAAAPQRLPAMPIPQRSPIAAALARLATRLLAAQAPAADGSVPADFLALARQVSAAADAPSAAERLPNLELATRLFGLSQDEEDLLLLASLVEVDPGAARLVALLNDHAGRTRPTLGVVRDLGGRLDAVIERLLGGGPLLRLGLVSLEGDGPWSTRCVKVDAAVWPLLLGLQRTPPFTLQAGEAPAADLQALPEEVVSACARAAGSLTPRSASSVLLAVAGDDGVGRLSMARSIAAAWRPQAIVIDAAAIAGPETIAALARETLWSHAVLIVTHAEDLAPTLWRALNDRVDAPLVVTAQQRGLGALALHSARPLVEVRAPRRDAKQRLRLWRARAPGAWPAEALRDLAERFDFGHDQIGTALGLAAARRTAAGAADAVPEIDDVRRACETLRETRFAGTAERIDCPHDPEDIVLRPETRRELDLALAWARHGAQVFAADGAGAALRAGGGLACLFSGPPGGGKTMAAQIVARQLDYALYRVDLSQVVDKFIGESEKKLAALFDEAQRARVALFFDEADALFGKRTEVRDSHDRYANITVDYLLQRIEAFDGLAILATNLAGNIDDAFLRRMRIRANFPAPDAADRRRIWVKLLPRPPACEDDIDIARLADGFELVGGEIRNAIYTAHLLAAHQGRKLAMQHCVAGLVRELNKTGRVSNLTQLSPWIAEHAAKSVHNRPDEIAARNQ